MRVAIMQPSFIPWLGYFALIKSVDKFVFLDDVQFDKRSWQQRNYIFNNNSPFLLTVPVFSKGKMSQKINETVIDESSKYKNKHLKSIVQAYSKAPFKKQVEELLRSSYDRNHRFLQTSTLI